MPWRGAPLCQEHGIVPIVEPEVLCSGDHDLSASARASALALSALFDHLGQAGVDLTGIVLKANFVTPGLAAAKVSAAEVAAATDQVLRDHVPATVAGIAFLSGGHPTEDACAFLGALKDISDRPWDVTFSFGRALVNSTLHTWAGSADRVLLAQQQLLDNCAQAAAAAR